MRTAWCAPGKGATMTDLLTAANKALPYLCNINGKGLPYNGRTSLYIKDEGIWEAYDIDRINAAGEELYQRLYLQTKGKLK